MSKPVVCFDFDGTLVDKNGRIHSRDIEILREEDRVVFVPATGRPLHAVRHAFERNGLFFKPSIPFPLILQNGAVTYLPHESLFTQTPLSAEVQDQLLKISQRHPQICCFLFSLNKLEIMWPNQLGYEMIERFDLDSQPYLGANLPYTKITYVSDSRAAMNALAQEISPLSVEASYSLPTVFELTQAGVDKGRMLIKLLTSMGLQSGKIIVAGDGENDLPLFDTADVSFCPTNSPALIKRRADKEINIAETGLLAPMLIEVGIEPL